MVVFSSRTAPSILLTVRSKRSWLHCASSMVRRPLPFMRTAVVWRLDLVSQSQGTPHTSLARKVFVENSWVFFHSLTSFHRFERPELCAKERCFCWCGWLRWRRVCSFNCDDFSRQGIKVCAGCLRPVYVLLNLLFAYLSETFVQFLFTTSPTENSPFLRISQTLTRSMRTSVESFVSRVPFLTSSLFMFRNTSRRESFFLISTTALQVPWLRQIESQRGTRSDLYFLACNYLCLSCNFDVDLIVPCIPAYYYLLIF